MPRRVRPRAHRPPDPLRGSAIARRYPGRDDDRRPAHHEEAVRVVLRGPSAPGRSRRWRSWTTSPSFSEPTALSAIEALQPDVYVKGPEYADLMLDKSRNIYHEMRVLEGYGGRMHFTSGETFSSTQAVAFPAGVARGGAARPAAAQRPRPLPGHLDRSASRWSCLKSYRGAAAGLRVCVIGETIVDEWVDVAVTNLSTEVAMRRRRRNGAGRQIGGAGIIALHLAGFVTRGRLLHERWTPSDAPRNLRQTSPRLWRRSSRRGSSTATPACRCSSRRDSTLASVRRDACPTSTTTTWC